MNGDWLYFSHVKNAIRKPDWTYRFFHRWNIAHIEFYLQGLLPKILAIYTIKGVSSWSVSGVCNSRFLDTDYLEKALRARNVSGALEKRTLNRSVWRFRIGSASGEFQRPVNGDNSIDIDIKLPTDSDIVMFMALQIDNFDTRSKSIRIDKNRSQSFCDYRFLSISIDFINSIDFNHPPQMLVGSYNLL